VLVVSTILVLFAGISFSSSNISGGVIRTGWINQFLKIGVPRFKELQFQPGTVELQQLIANLTPVDYYDIPKYFLLYSPLVTGLVAGELFLGLMALVKYFLNKFVLIKSTAYAVFALLVFWGIGIILLPTDLLGNGYKSYDCTGNVIAAFEESGKYLAETIPPGAQIYWNGYSPVNLLYIPEVKVHTPQLNLVYSFSSGGDSEALLRYGWWDDTLSDKWLQETDYVLSEQRYFRRGGEVPTLLFSEGFEELPPAPSTAACVDDAYIRIFRRIP
jgi:hypothetical protein